MSVTFQLSKAGLEIYTTAPMESEKDKDKEKDKDSKKESEEESTDETTFTGDASTNFVLQNGEIRKINYLGELYSDSYEMDYIELTSNSSVSVPIDFMEHFFKGKKVALKKGWKTTDTYKWEDLQTAVLGFVTELTWNKDKIDVKISGMDKLMEKSETFEFTQTKRSEIVTEIIKAAGLKPKVDVTGLKDDVIDFKTTSTDTSDSTGDGESTGSATIDEAVENAIKGKTSAIDKAKAVDKAFKSHIIYQLYYNCKYSNLEAAWKAANLNCADGANILCAMFIKAGLDATIIHVPPEYSKGYGHYIVRVTINGKQYFTDNAASSGCHTTRPFGQVFGQPIGSEVGKRIG